MDAVVFGFDKGLSIDPIRVGILITACMIPFGVFQLILGRFRQEVCKRIQAAASFFFLMATPSTNSTPS